MRYSIDDKEFYKNILNADTEQKAKKLLKNIQEEVYNNATYYLNRGKDLGKADLISSFKLLFDIKDPIDPYEN